MDEKRRETKKGRDAQLIKRVTEALRTAYHADMSIALCGEFEEVARYSVRRWRSYARRGVPKDDVTARVRDLAKGLSRRRGGAYGGILPHIMRTAEAASTALPL
jgi:hypothetical protein